MSRTPAAGARGFTVLETMVAGAILAAAILGTIYMTLVALRTLSGAREMQAARAAVTKVKEALSVVKIRAANSTDTTESLFQGGYEIARTVSGTSFPMPSRRATTLANETVVVAGASTTVGGTLNVDFPAPPLRGLAGRPQNLGVEMPGRIVFYLSETAQPAQSTTLPITLNQGFPFPPTPGLAKLDCDGDGVVTTADLRTKTSDQSAPYRLIPVRISVEWRTEASGAAERYEEFYLIAFEGINN